MKRMFIFFLMMGSLSAFADDSADLISNAEQMFEATRIVCSGVSDDIAKVANISKANTAVTAVGTVAAGGALAVGIAKSKKDEQVETLMNELCALGGCDAQTIRNMNTEEKFQVMNKLAEISELMEQIQQENNKAKKLGNWRTGLMAGTIGTNLASAIMSGLNINQSDLIQHITACNDMVKTVSNIELDLKAAGIGPMDNPVVKKLGNVKTWCNQIDIKDIEKIENRMKGVMGTSIAGTAIGVIGVGTSAAANSDKYMNIENKIGLSAEEKKKEKALNTTANVMAGANTVAGAVETGLNISLISLTKKLMDQAKRCEEILQ